MRNTVTFGDQVQAAWAICGPWTLGNEGLRFFCRAAAMWENVEFLGLSVDEVPRCCRPGVVALKGGYQGILLSGGVAALAAMTEEQLELLFIWL